ncbi:MAG: sodium-dependent transporter [Spirochaetes bacterium]|nr:sodium-dependent transporter [Spirochaetota bacterium]MBU0955191.1 sodium-dependent transporter [Spirochaetota bacterium]
MSTERSKWSSRSAFVLAAIGSAVGLGNAWRFPGLAAKHGGGAFLLVYLIAMLVMGVPLLMMEIAIGRKMKQGAAGSMRGLNKKLEPIGWAAVANAFVISVYYAAVFAWVLLMVVKSIDFAGMTGDTVAASQLWLTTIKTTGAVSGIGVLPLSLLAAFLVAWGSIYYCIRNGAASVSKVVKYTVFIPVVLLLVMAVNGLRMPGAMDGVAKFFIPDFSVLGNAAIWVDAVGQVFFSLSIMMAVMFAYGSFLERDSNIAVDGLIIAFSDMAISVLAGVVMFSTMGGVGMLDKISTSGIATAFIVYPQAIVTLTNIGWVNVIFGMVFYLCLATLAVDSAFSLVEGVSTSISDKFKLDHKKTTLNISIIMAAMGLIFLTGAGLAWLDIVDNFTNQFNMIIIGILECVAIGWFFKTERVLDEINLNSQKWKMPGWWFNTSVRFAAPVLLVFLLVWNVISLIKAGGVYGAADGYPLWANIVGGWLITILVFASGYIVKLIAAARARKGLVEDESSWS